MPNRSAALDRFDGSVVDAASTRAGRALQATRRTRI
jgi:hypothetical protein